MADSDGVVIDFGVRDKELLCQPGTGMTTRQLPPRLNQPESKPHRQLLQFSQLIGGSLNCRNQIHIEDMR